MEVDRRELLKQLSMLMAGLGGAAAMSSCKKEPEGTSKPPLTAADAAVDKAPLPSESARGLVGDQRKTLEAAVERILPTDQDPGAKEADVIEYVDRELGRPEFENLKTHMVGGVVALNRVARRRANKSFYDLAPLEQDEILKELQSKSARGKDFVEFLVLLTLEGFIGDPRWGGNKGGVGWKFIGYGPGTVDGTVTRCNDDQ